MKRLMTSCFGLGWLPIAPGTWGSLPPRFVLGLMGYMGPSPVAIAIVMGVLMVWGSAVCVLLAPAAIAETGSKDPGEVVVDEVAGQAVCYLAVPFMAVQSMTVMQFWIVAIGGFLLFRVFDIFKPWPANRLEGLPKGWGILADDLMAGLYAGVCLWIAVRLWIG
jgi:phosphatidylglycerophosphatase A